MSGVSLRNAAIFALAVVRLACASEYHGIVLFKNQPLPGALLTATRDGSKYSAVSDERGIYSFPDLPDGTWTLNIDMTGFGSLEQKITIAPGTPSGKWELTMLPADRILSAKPATQQAQAIPPPEPELAEQATEGLLINGSENNGAASVFRQDAAFGNHRKRLGALYNGGIGMIVENSALDAAPFSLTGQNTPKPSYNDLTGVLTFGGPFRIPHLVTNGPVFFVGYQWTRDRNAVTETALLPTPAQRASLPAALTSPQAESLLGLYPLPNFPGSSRYNFQMPAVSATHEDALQSRIDKTLGRNEFSGLLGFQSTRKDTPNILGFADSSDTLGLNARANFSRTLHHGLLWNLSYQFSRFSEDVRPYFANRANISGNAGISGNDQSPIDWGPPTLVFASGIASLTDANPASNHVQTDTESTSIVWTHRSHSTTFGTDYRREQLNFLTQQNPRGTLSFTGAVTGSDFTDFLKGIPDTSSIAFGTADKYLRDSGYDGYVADDWRVNASLTLNAGIRWDYAAPMTELYNRLANLDIAGNFGAAAPVLAGNPVGPLTAQHFSNALMRPDRDGWQPRIGVAWRAPTTTSLVVRAGYGVYYNTSVYETIATQLAQQPPFSKTFTIQNSAANPLTLTDPFIEPATGFTNTYAIDPNFRVGYVQNWQVSVQRDLPKSLILLLTYNGLKGTRGTQEFLPNTVPPGSFASCPLCPSGFVYLTSNGNSSREALEIELRRRLHNGITAQLRYTYAKSLDDDAFLGGSGNGITPAEGAAPQTPETLQAPQPSSTQAVVSQNWNNLAADRGPSSFDERHLLTAQLQYTSGMGMKGGTLLNGWRGALLKEWTVATQITAGSGLPLNPVYFVPVPGTGITGTVRPNYTGAPVYNAPSGLSLNPGAFSAPLAGEWGNAGRNSITGPMVFTLDATLGRTFRPKDRLNLDLRFDATNALNHVTYTSWNTVINNSQFGLPVSANAMRTVQTTLRLRF